MKEQDETPQKQPNEVETGDLSEKRIQNNDGKDDPGPWESNEEDARNVY